MTTRWFSGLAAVALLAVFAAPLALQAEEEAPPAVRHFDRGMAHLRQAELDKALAAFKQASEADPSTERYAQQAMIVKRVIGMRKYVDEKPVSAKWERMAEALHVFYLQHQSHAAALALARRAHGLLKNTGSEARLGLDPSDYCQEVDLS